MLLNCNNIKIVHFLEYTNCNVYNLSKYNKQKK